MSSTNISQVEVTKLYNKSFLPALQVTIVLNSCAFGTSIFTTEYSALSFKHTAQKLVGRNAENQKDIDSFLMGLDLEYIIPLSAAVSRAMASHLNMALYRYLNNVNAYILPQYLFQYDHFKKKLGSVLIEKVFLLSEADNFPATIEHINFLNKGDVLDFSAISAPSLIQDKNLPYVLQLDKTNFLKDYLTTESIRDLLFFIHTLIDKNILAALKIPSINKGMYDLLNYTFIDKVELIYDDDLATVAGNTVVIKASDIVSVSFIKEKIEYLKSINQNVLLENDLSSDPTLFTDIAVAYGVGMIQTHAINATETINRLIVLAEDLQRQTHN